MKEVLQKYKKLIFGYSVFNCTALLINLFDIRGEIKTSTGPVNLFSDSFSNGTNKFWPFVSYTYNYSPGYGTNLTAFNGIFYQYKWEEFISYMGILFAFLLYKAYISKPLIKTVVSQS